jgi:hypothetical protein
MMTELPKPEELPGLLQTELEQCVRTALGIYLSQGALESLDVGPILPRPDRPYAASAEVIFNAGKKKEMIATSMPCVIFMPGDATGRSASQEKPAISVPGKLITGAHKAQDYIPRNKSAVALEVMIPLFFRWGAREGITQRGYASLELLTLEPVEELQDVVEGLSVVKADHYIGTVAPPSGRSDFDFAGPTRARPTLTVGYTPSGTRFGDPHAVRAPITGWPGITAVGFIAFTKENVKKLEGNNDFYERLIADAIRPIKISK